MPDLVFQDLMNLFSGVNTLIPGWGDGFRNQINHIHDQLYWGLLARRLDLTLPDDNGGGGQGLSVDFFTVPQAVKVLITDVLIFRRGAGVTGRNFRIGVPVNLGLWNNGFNTNLLLNDDQPLRIQNSLGNTQYGVQSTHLVLLDGDDPQYFQLRGQHQQGTPVSLDWWFYGIIYVPQS